MFSVIIPAYNCENTIIRTLQSVADQTRVDLVEEIIIINDGSSDHTESAVHEFIANNKNVPVRYLRQDNHGVSYTRNKAIRMANAEWVALLDSDDVWLESKLERQYEMIAGNPQISFLGSAYPLKILFGKREGLCKLSAKELCLRNMPNTPSVVFKKSVGVELGLFDENMKYCEDINFYQKFLLKDSYYVLAEKLIEVSIGKDFFSQSGLSSHLKQMHMGRNRNTRELHEMGLISRSYMYVMLIMNEMKYVRRVVQKKLLTMKYKA